MYALSKLKCENFLKKKENMKYVILRYFNVAGADIKLRSGLISKKKSTHLIKKLCENFIKQKKIIINGNNYPTIDGTPVRDYMHVHDLALAHYNASKYLLKNGKSDVFNCGYGKGYSVLEIIKAFNKLNKKKLKFKLEKEEKETLPKLLQKLVKSKKFELESKIQFN